MNNPLDKVARLANSVRVLAQSGLLGPYRPDQMRRHDQGRTPLRAFDGRRLRPACGAGPRTDWR